MKDGLSGIVNLEFDEETGETILPLSDALLAGAGWKDGDVLEWINNNNGTWTLRKKQMTNFTFTCTRENSNITMNIFNVDNVDDVYFEFTQFLKGCGYQYEIETLPDTFPTSEYNFDAVDHFWGNTEKSEFFWDSERNK